MITEVTRVESTLPLALAFSWNAEDEECIPHIVVEDSNETDLGTLDDKEREDLAEYEDWIEEGKDAVFSLGHALFQIKKTLPRDPPLV